MVAAAGARGASVAVAVASRARASSNGGNGDAHDDAMTLLVDATVAVADGDAAPLEAGVPRAAGARAAGTSTDGAAVEGATTAAATPGDASASAVSKAPDEGHVDLAEASAAADGTPVGSQVPERTNKPSNGSMRARSRVVGRGGHSPSDHNFTMLLGPRGEVQVSVVVLRHQGDNGRHPRDNKLFYYQARIRNSYPQKHIWSGWAVRLSAAEGPLGSRRTHTGLN
jgi:hypothetical protein